MNWKPQSAPQITWRTGTFRLNTNLKMRWDTVVISPHASISLLFAWRPKWWINIVIFCDNLTWNLICDGIICWILWWPLDICDGLPLIIAFLHLVGDLVDIFSIKLWWPKNISINRTPFCQFYLQPDTIKRWRFVSLVRPQLKSTPFRAPVSEKLSKKRCQKWCVQGVTHRNRNGLIGNLLRKSKNGVLRIYQNPVQCREFPKESWILAFSC